MQERRAKHAKESGASLGAVVRIGKDYRDVCNPRCAIGVIAQFKDETGGVQVITEYGVICQGVQKKTFWIPSENYEVIVAADDLETHPLVTPELAEVRRQVLAGILELDSRDKLTLQQDQKLYLGLNETPKKGRSKGCNCGKGKRVRQCTQKCSCIRRKVGCTSSCLCMGNCSENKHNK